MKNLKAIIFILLAIIVLIVGFAVLDYCAGAGTSVTSSTFFFHLNGALMGIFDAISVICALVIAFISGFVALMPLIGILVCLLALAQKLGLIKRFSGSAGKR